MTASRHLAPVPEDDLDRLGQEIIALIVRADRDLLSASRRYHRAGCLLLEARDLCPHGTWLPWLREQGISQPTAWRCIRLAENYSDLKDLPSSVTAAIEALNPPKPKPSPKHPMEELWARWQRVVPYIGPLGSRPHGQGRQAEAWSADMEARRAEREADPEWRAERARSNVRSGGALIRNGRRMIQEGKAELAALGRRSAEPADFQAITFDEGLEDSSEADR